MTSAESDPRPAPDPDSDAALAIAAAEAGAAVALAMYGKSRVHFDKSPTDFATDADLAAEAAVLDVLRKARPEDALVGEESGASGSETSGRRWLVDPLCGTLNYAALTPLVSVNVTLQVGSELAAAASADPFNGEVFWTDGQAAFVRAQGVDQRLTGPATSHLVDIDLDVPTVDPAGFRPAELIGDPLFTRSFRTRILSTTLALAWVAAGRHAAYVSAGDMRDSVHYSAGIALCQAAGCVVTGLRGQPLHTGPGGLVAAADEQTHAELVALINRQFD